MSKAARYLNQIENPYHRAGAWLAAGLLACLMGTISWLMAGVFWVVGALTVHLLGLDVPTWASWFALLGMPVGAWLEIWFSN